MVKYRHKDSSLILKITDNDKVCGAILSEWKPLKVLFLQCIKYRTDQQQDLKKLEKLNTLLIRQMVSKEK